MKILILKPRRHHRHSSALMPDGPAAPLVFSATDRTSGPVICLLWQDGDQGRESEEIIVDRLTDLTSGCFSFSTTWCRSLLISFSTCCLDILGLERAINCILARTSHQRTTSEKRTKALLPKYPLFGGSTVLQSIISLCNPIGMHDAWENTISLLPTKWFELVWE